MEIDESTFLRFWIKAECRRQLGTISFNSNKLIADIVDRHAPAFAEVSDITWHVLEDRMRWFRSGMLRNLLQLPDIRFFDLRITAEDLANRFRDCWKEPGDTMAEFARKNPDYGTKETVGKTHLLAVSDPVGRRVFLIEGYNRACALIRNDPTRRSIRLGLAIVPRLSAWERCPAQFAIDCAVCGAPDSNEECAACAAPAAREDD